MAYYENGILMNDNGLPQNMHDYLKVSMVLRNNGENAYPRIFDYNTKNQSFLNVHKLLKDLGIKNHSEHLQLFNPKLLGVDPHSPNIPENVRMMIDQEIRKNIWYYLREIVRVPMGDKVGYFDLNIGSFTVTWLITRRQNFFYEISRQVGKTYLLTTILGWVLLFGGTKIRSANMHHSSESAINNLNQIKASLESIPAWLHYHKKEVHKVDKNGKLKIKNTLSKSDNSRTLENKIFKNIIETVVVGTSKDQAYKAGRGATRHIYLIDEISHIKNNNIAFGTLNQSTTRSREFAQKAGFIHGIWQLGTPGDLGTPYGKWMYERITQEYIPFGYEQVYLFDYTTEELEEYISQRSISNFWHVKYDWEVLGFDEKWFFEKNRNEEVSVIRSEVLLNWTTESKDNPFTRAELAALEAKSRNKIIKVWDLDDRNRFYLFPEPGEVCNDLTTFLVFNFRHGVVIGIDVASGVGEDSSTMVFVDSKTLRPIAVYKNNRIDTDDFAILIAHIVEKIIIPNEIKLAIGIERNNVGAGVLARLKKYEAVKQYLLAYPVSDAKMNDLDKPVDVYRNGNKMDYGITVGDKIRHLFTVVLLSSLVKKHTLAYAIEPIVNEVKGLLKNKKLDRVRIEHGPSSHDDVLFGSFHAYYPLYYAQDILKKFHGIIVEPSKWLISDGVEVISNAKPEKRIVTRYVSDASGVLHVKYYDTHSGKYVNKDDAIRLEEEFESNMSFSMNTENQSSLEEPMKIKEKNDGYEFIVGKNNVQEAVLFPDELEGSMVDKSITMLSELYSQFNRNF